MAAEDISSGLSVIGAPIGGGSSVSGKGLVFGIYGITCTENGDWVILSDFDECVAAAAFAVASDVHTIEAVEVDTTVANKIILTAGGTDVMRIWVWGTPAAKG